MIRSISRHAVLGFVLLAGSPGVGFAQSDAAAPVSAPAPASDTRRLSDAERDAILDHNTVESAAIARGERETPGGLPPVHGEIGAMIGSNGARGIYGTAAVPLGDNAGAVVSFESSQFGGYRR